VGQQRPGPLGVRAAGPHPRPQRAVRCADVHPYIVDGARWIRDNRSEFGPLHSGWSAEHLGEKDKPHYWDDFWGVAGLRAAAELLGAADQHDAAEQVTRAADSFWADMKASLGLVAQRLESEAIPAGPRRRLDAGAIGSLVACDPLHLLAGDDPRIMATLDVIRDRFMLGDAFFQAISHTGLGTYLTLQVATVELAVGDRRALTRLDWLLASATPTFTWPEAIHPRLPGGCMGDGHHGWAAADFLSLVRHLLVRELDTPDPALALCTLLPEAWKGRGLEVHDAPTHFGKLSYAVRWHGERPALLWELEPHDPGATVRVTAPGLDPTWSTSEPRGDALLAPVPADSGLATEATG